MHPLCPFFLEWMGKVPCEECELSEDLFHYGSWGRMCEFEAAMDARLILRVAAIGVASKVH